MDNIKIDFSVTALKIGAQFPVLFRDDAFFLQQKVDAFNLLCGSDLLSEEEVSKVKSRLEALVQVEVKKAKAHRKAQVDKGAKK